MIESVLYSTRESGRILGIWEYPRSSAGLYCGHVDHDILVQKSPLLAEVTDWEAFLTVDSGLDKVLEEKNRTGRPFGSAQFYSIVEEITGRDTRPGRPTGKQ